MTDFVHLHLHSEYSLLDGACRISDIAKAAKENGHNAVALTDHGAMYGAVAFYRECKKEGIKPIIGCEMYVAPNNRQDRSFDKDKSPYHLVLLAKNEIGYKNLIYLDTVAFCEGFYIKPRIDMSILAEHSEGIIALSACLGGYIPRKIMAGEFEAAKEYALKMKAIFGEDFYLELQNHFLDKQAEVNKAIIEMSKELSIPLVATNDVHYISRKDADTQAILMCIQMNTTLDGGRPLGFETDEFYYKSTAEMERLFGYVPEALENTQKIADKCSFDFCFDKIYLPKFETGELSAGEFLREKTLEGYKKYIAQNRITFEKNSESDYLSRIEYELSVIDKMGYADYYLIVWDYVKFAKDNLIPTGPGRGSGAGSLVAYLLDITEVDPLVYGLMFERFLNPQRVSMPDFDIDFCYIRRGEVIDYVTRKYGEDRVSQIATFGTLGAKAAIRDVTRALGYSYSDGDILAKCIPQQLNMTLQKALDEPNSILKKHYEANAQYRKIIDIAMSVEGMPRDVSTHAAGVVISDKPIVQYVPMAQSSDMRIIQFDMNTVADLGLLKFDFLGLRNITIISDAEKMIKSTNSDFSVSKIPFDDKKTFALLSSGKTDGIFQLESGGMRSLLMQMKPNCVEDIMTAIALYRPGPMESIPKFLENRQNPSKISYKDEKLAEILDETCGCIVYQEQVMNLCCKIAGFSYGQADIIRRAMSKKKKKEMEDAREAFVFGKTDESGNVICDGAIKNGMSEAVANELFDEIAAFASYAFNKSHAATYTYISYRTAYLKAHYPAEYFAALLASVLGDNTKTAAYVAEMTKYGIKLLPPSINESDKSYTVIYLENGEKAVRYGLLALKNVGESFIDSIIAERKRTPFASFVDFVERMKNKNINKRQVESLLKCGAFDNMGAFRSQLLCEYERVIDLFTSQSRRVLDGQIDIFSTAAEDDYDIAVVYDFSPMPELSKKEMLVLEKEVSGMYFSGHLLDEYRGYISRRSFDMTSEIISQGEKYPDKSKVCVFGIISDITVKNTKNGEKMAFLQLDDGFGELEIVVFPRTLQKYAPIIQREAALRISGDLSYREDMPPSILAQEISLPNENDGDEYISQRPQNKVSVEKIKTLYLRVPSKTDEKFTKIENILDLFRGNIPVMLYDESEKKYLKCSTGIDLLPNVRRYLIMLLGENNVVFK